MKIFEILEQIKPLDIEAMKKARERLDSLAKPVGSLGKLEEIAERIAGITSNVYNHLNKKAIIVMCADNGVLEEGVSAAPKEFTALISRNILRGLGGISVLSRHAEADCFVIDIGVDGEIEHEKVINKKIRRGTFNIAKGPAMTMDEAIKAIEVGMNFVMEKADEGYKLFGTGEVGMGNTTTSCAIIMMYTGLGADEVVGRGAGLTQEAYEKKKYVVKKAIEINKPNMENPLDVLHKIGGLDIAGLVGCYIGAAFKRVPIVVDGLISISAAVLATQLNPLIKYYLIPSHYSAEPAFRAAAELLGLSPMLDMNMRLGEGTGAALAFNIIDASTKIIREMGTFEDALLSDFEYTKKAKDLWNFPV